MFRMKKIQLFYNKNVNEIQSFFKDNISMLFVLKIEENFFENFGLKYDDSLSDCFAMHSSSKNNSQNLNIFVNIFLQYRFTLYSLRKRFSFELSYFSCVTQLGNSFK